MVSIHFIFFSLVFVLLKRVKTTHVFESKAALKTAVDAWTSSATRASAESTYGYISSWDTSQVPDMSELFRDKSDLTATCYHGMSPVLITWLTCFLVPHHSTATCHLGMSLV